MALIHDFQLGERTQDIKISEDVTFETMLLSRRTLNGLKNVGFYRPSPIQLHGIPLGKCGFDLLLEAKSGTGKTAVFTIITLEKVNLNKALQAIILAPTREIAAQICNVIKQIGSQYEGLIVEVVMGGLPVQDDIEKFKKRVHVIVGSPGRLKHLIQSKHIDVSSVKVLVLDECDKLMDKSFLPDVDYIFSELPIQKQVIMSSATYPENCLKFINTYVKCAQRVCPNSNSILVGIGQYVINVPSNINIVQQTNYKFQELLNILSNHEYKQCLIFCNYMARAIDIHKRLKKEKWPVELLHGQQDQTHRLNTLKALQQYKCRILMATDLAARGIDASNIDLVINFEPPFDWQTYLHRIGRAGRFGSYGIAVTILSEGKEVNKFKTVIRTMEIPILLKNLWTGDEFDIKSQDDETIQHPKDTTTVEEKAIENSTDLWFLLTRKENKNIEPFESFEALLKSNQKSNESKIHTFSEFLQSFENEKEVSYDNEDIVPEYITLKEYLYNIKEGDFNLIKAAPLNDGCKNLENGIHTYNVYQNQNDLDDNCFTKENSHLYFNKNEIILSDNEDVKNNNNDLKYTERAVLEVNLPKSFAETKYEKSISKVINKNKKSNKLIDNFESNSKKGFGQDKYIKSEIYESKQKTSLNGKNKKYDSNKVTLPQSAHKINKKTQKDIGTGLNYSRDHLSTIEMQHNNLSHFDYNAWYNRFKVHMKYIEHSFYIEEMSNLEGISK